MFFKRRNNKDRDKSLIAALNREDRNFRLRYSDSGSGYFGFVGSIVLAVICLLLLIWTTVATVRHLNIYNNGNQTTGTVYRVERRSGSRGRVTFTVFVRYEANNRERIQRVNTDFFGGGIGNREIGSTVNIRYHPNNPNYIFNGTRNWIIGNVIFYGILFGGGMLFGVFGARFRYRHRKDY